MKKRTNVKNSTWHGPATWPMLWQEAGRHGRLRVLSVDRASGALVIETFGKMNWANYKGEWRWR